MKSSHSLRVLPTQSPQERLGRRRGSDASGACRAVDRRARDKDQHRRGKKYRPLFQPDSDPNTTRLEELTLLPIGGRQVVVRTEVSQCCYTMTARIFGTQDPPDPKGPQAPAIVNDPNNAAIQGHGGVGIVEAIGPQVRRVQVGDRVIVPVTPQCGVCYDCLRGRADRCQSNAGQKALAVATRSDGSKAFGNGGLSELMVVYEESCVPVFTSAKSIDRPCCTVSADAASAPP